MSLRADGVYRCDRCDADVGNGAVHTAAVVVDLHPDRPFESRQLHLCRVNGCAATVLSAETLPYWGTP